MPLFEMEGGGGFFALEGVEPSNLSACAQSVVIWLGLEAPTERIVEVIEFVCGAFDAYAEQHYNVPDDNEAWNLGKTMQVARWVERSKTPTGIASFGEVGFSFVSRFDDDVRAVLGAFEKLDGWA